MMLFLKIQLFLSYESIVRNYRIVRIVLNVRVITYVQYEE